MGMMIVIQIKRHTDRQRGRKKEIKTQREIEREGGREIEIERERERERKRTFPSNVLQKRSSKDCTYFKL